MENLTKKELLNVAKEMKIVGRHDMSRDELEAAIVAARPTGPKHDAFEGNFIPTKPFRGRPYSVVGKNKEAYDALPPQAKAIFKFMEEKGYVGRGDSIVQAAVNAGYLKTTQDPATLFAFYARKLEDAGIRLTT